MLWSLLLPLLWAGDWGQGQRPWVQSQANPHFFAGSLAQDGKFQLTVPKSVVVQEGLCVRVPCRVVYPTTSGSVFSYWFLTGADPNKNPAVATSDPKKAVKEDTRGRFHLTGDLKNGDCSLLISDAQKRDTGVYFFRLDGDSFVKYSFKENLLSVDVWALTETPEVKGLATLVAGSTSLLTCSVPGACEQGTPPIFSWMSAALSSLGPRTTLSSVLTLTPRPQDHGTNLTCQVTFPGASVTVEKTEQLHVTYAPQKLVIKASLGDDMEPQLLHSGSSLEVPEGGSLRLVCMADSNPPATLSWEGATPRLVQPSSPEELRLSRVELQDRGDYVCRAQNTLGTQVASVSLRVTSPLQLLGPSCSWEAEGLHCTCSSRAWPTPSLRWWLGEGLLEGNLSNSSFAISASAMGPWANSSVSLHRDVVTSLSLSCKAQNDHGAQSATVLLPRGQDVTKEQPQASMGVVQGAFVGAGSVVLLAVCVCLIFYIVKTCRRKSAQKVAKTSKEGSHLAKSPVFKNYQNAPGSDIQKGQSPPDTATAKEEPDLHYASLTFKGLKPRQPQNSEATKSDYAEIKTHK